MKVAVTVRVSVIITVQLLAEPLQAPLQPAKVESSLGVAVNVTSWASQKAPVHLAPQLMPPGSDATVPDPLPDLITRRSYSLTATLAGPPPEETAAERTGR